MTHFLNVPSNLDISSILQKFCSLHFNAATELIYFKNDIMKNLFKPLIEHLINT